MEYTETQKGSSWTTGMGIWEIPLCFWIGWVAVLAREGSDMGSYFLRLEYRFTNKRKQSYAKTYCT